MSETSHAKTANAPGPVTMAILGCGKLGSAILFRLLKSVDKLARTSDATEDDQIDLGILPTRFLACVNSAESVEALVDRLSEYNAGLKQTGTANTKDAIGGSRPRRSKVEIWRGCNTEAAMQAKVILIACQSGQVPEILAEDGMVDALEGKLILNICAGSSEKLFREQMESVQRTNTKNTQHSTPDGQQNSLQYHFVHAMPNPASMVGESATVLSPRAEDFPVIYGSITNWVFRHIGPIFEVA
ncbi:hypothetical protein F4679DRAFT_535259 [Xylaria curta]|nr:hypothetical protein F4679DRAFT_535259 [Xylaria curta]